MHCSPPRDDHLRWGSREKQIFRFSLEKELLDQWGFRSSNKYMLNLSELKFSIEDKGLFSNR